jgi:hypothetical protein
MRRRPGRDRSAAPALPGVARDDKHVLGIADDRGEPSR